jgi:hypothetical protein
LTEYQVKTAMVLGVEMDLLLAQVGLLKISLCGQKAR